MRHIEVGFWKEKKRQKQLFEWKIQIKRRKKDEEEINNNKNITTFVFLKPIMDTYPARFSNYRIICTHLFPF